MTSETKNLSQKYDHTVGFLMRNVHRHIQTEEF